LLAGQMEDRYIRSLRHFDLADLPVHGFSGSPWQLHLL
jgi:hypothetical protein